MGKAPDQRPSKEKPIPANQVKREHAERIADIAARVEAWRAYRIKCLSTPKDAKTHEEEIKLLDSWKHEFGIPLSFYGCPFEGNENFDRWSKGFMREVVRHVTTGLPSLEFIAMLDVHEDLDFSWFLIGIPYRELSHKDSFAFLMEAFGFDEKDARRFAIEESEDEGVLVSSFSHVTPPLHLGLTPPAAPDLF